MTCRTVIEYAPSRRKPHAKETHMPEEVRRPRVGLFVTCLVDLFRPAVGFAAVKLIEEAGCDVEVPPSQTCCGQPAYNSGDRRDTRAIARQVIETFEVGFHPFHLGVGDKYNAVDTFEDQFAAGIIKDLAG